MQKLTVDELGIVVALVIAGVLFLTGGKAPLGALLCVAAVAFAVVLWTPVRQRLHIPPPHGGHCGDRERATGATEPLTKTARLLSGRLPIQVWPNRDGQGYVPERAD